MVLDVDLQCSKCYKKVKKLLCKFPEIRDQEYDEKANKVTIKVVCCSPEKIRDKLRCKGGRSIRKIVIKEGAKPKPPADKKEEKKDEKKKKPKKRPETRDDGDEPSRSPPRKLRYPPPSSPVIGFWCNEGSIPSGMPGNPCYRGGPVQFVGYYGRPIYDSWGGDCCDYFTEENQQSCSIM